MALNSSSSHRSSSDKDEEQGTSALCRNVFYMNDHKQLVSDYLLSQSVIVFIIISSLTKIVNTIIAPIQDCLFPFKDVDQFYVGTNARGKT